MAQEINAILHNFVDEKDVSSSGEDDCSSAESDIEVEVLRAAVCAHGESEDDPTNEDGGANVDEQHVSEFSDAAKPPTAAKPIVHPPPKKSSFPLLHSSVQITIHSEEKQCLPKCNSCPKVRCIRVHACKDHGFGVFGGVH